MVTVAPLSNSLQLKEMKSKDKNLYCRRAFIYSPGKKDLRAEVIKPTSCCTNFSPANFVFLITYLGKAWLNVNCNLAS